MKAFILLLLFPLSALSQVVVGNGLVQYVTSAPSGACSQNAQMQIVFGVGSIYTCQTNTWTQAGGGGGGTGTVTSVATTSPITGGTITATGTIACANCTTSTSPAAGVAHFAGSTQDMTSSKIVAADITNATITGTQIASSIALAGSPTTTSQTTNDNSTKIATTAYVDTKNASCSATNTGSRACLETHTAATTATLDFTCVTNSSYHAFQFVFTNIIPATTGGSWELEAGTGAGPSWDTTSNIYQWGNVNVTGAGATAANGNNTNATALLISTAAGVSTALANNGGVSGMATVANPAGGTSFSNFNYQINYWNSSSNFVDVYGGGGYKATTALTGVRFLFNNGSITSGTITCYGVTP